MLADRCEEARHAVVARELRIAGYVIKKGRLPQPLSGPGARTRTGCGFRYRSIGSGVTDSAGATGRTAGGRLRLGGGLSFADRQARHPVADSHQGSR